MTRIAVVALVATSIFTTLAWAQEPPPGPDNHRPSGARSVYNVDMAAGPHVHAMQDSAAAPAGRQNPDPTLRNYSANISQWDMRSSR